LKYTLKTVNARSKVKNSIYFNQSNEIKGKKVHEYEQG